jgi:non-specific serine/threonine protein kinase
MVQGDAAAHSYGCAALALFRGPGEPSDIAAALNLLSIIALNRGEFESARALAEESLALRRQDAPAATHQQRRGLAEALSLLGTLLAAQCEFEKALPLLEESVASFRALEDPSALAYTLDLLGQSLYCQQGPSALERARALVDESIALFRSEGEKMWICRALWGRGHIARDDGDDELASSLYAEAVTLSLAGCNQLGLPYLLEAIGALAVSQGEPRRAARLLGAAQSLRETTGVIRVPLWLAEYEKAVIDARASDETAFSREWALGYALDWKQAASYALQTAPAN